MRFHIAVYFKNKSRPFPHYVKSQNNYDESHVEHDISNENHVCTYQSHSVFSHHY